MEVNAETSSKADRIDKPVVNKFQDLLQKAGITKLTSDELAWIKPPETFDPSIPRNDVSPDRISNICQKDRVQIQSEGLPPSIYETFRLAAVFSDKESPEDRLYPSLPDSNRVGQFIEFMASHERPVDTMEQFEKLLEISNYSVLDASILGMISSRMVARNLDKSLYPEIVITEEMRDRWQKNLLPFDRNNRPQDVLGDNYYFWTAVYTHIAFKESSYGNLFYKIMDKNAARIMSLSRRFLANQPTISDHSEAFKQGKATANILLNFAKRDYQKTL